MPLDDLRAFYRTGEQIELGTLPVGTTRVVARHALGAAVPAKVDGGAGLPASALAPTRSRLTLATGACWPKNSRP